MESSMVERVARALCAVDLNTGLSAEGVTEYVAGFWPNHIDHARAAIEAMRQPTEAMEESLPHRNLGDELSPSEIWTTMIAAALTPEMQKTLPP